MRWPVNNPVFGSPYGMRMHPTLGYEKMHYGQDFKNNTGSPLYAIADATVVSSVSVAQNPGGGNYISLRLADGAVARYFHMKNKSPLVPGQRVKEGDVVGYLGNTGTWTTGPHLHFELVNSLSKYTNPRTYIQARLTPSSVSQPTTGGGTIPTPAPTPVPLEELAMTPYPHIIKVMQNYTHGPAGIVFLVTQDSVDHVTAGQLNMLAARFDAAPVEITREDLQAYKDVLSIPYSAFAPESHWRR